MDLSFHLLWGNTVDTQPKDGMKKKIYHIYDKHYKKLLIFPMLLLVLALIQIGYQTATTGEFIIRDVSLKGGAVISIPYDKEVNLNEISLYLKSKFPEYGITVKSAKSLASKDIVIEAGIEGTQSEVNSIIKEVESYLNADFKKNYSVEIMGSSLGKSFFKEIIIALIVAFFLMSIVVFISFRVAVPCFAVILAAFSDIVVTIAIVNILGIKVSTAGIAAFLMLIGYSVDTDILLTTRVLKRKEGEVMERVMGAVKTGLTMTLAAIVAIGIALAVSKSEVITQIMSIVFIGLFVDIVNTWIQNVGMLRIYLERKAKGKLNESKN